MVDAAAPILETRDVVKHFAAGAHAVVHAVDVVTLSINRGETFAIVGESGCGKSTLARLLLRLIEPTSGQVLYEGQDLTAMPLDALRRVRADIQFIFQDPFSSLNPRMTVGALIGEPLLVHTRLTRFEREARVANLLRQVGLRPEHAERYPHEFSGGQRQRDRRDLPEVVGRGNAHHAEKRGKGERDATWQPGRSRLLVDRNMCQRSFGQHEVAGERPGEGRKPIESPIRTEVTASIRTSSTSPGSAPTMAAGPVRRCPGRPSGVGVSTIALWAGATCMPEFSGGKTLPRPLNVSMITVSPG